MAVITPTLLFHLYTLHVKSQVGKIKRTEEAMNALDGVGNTNNKNQLVSLIKMFKYDQLCISFKT